MLPLVSREAGDSEVHPDEVFKATLQAMIDERSQIEVVTAILPSCYDSDRERIALVQFHGGIRWFLSELMMNPLGDWQVEMGDTDVNFDCHFLGFTKLYTRRLRNNNQ
jgi:hypothetical protein